ncbi:MAG: YbaK/EbsC family protein [Geminicoccaceae bacterium]
MSALDRPAVQRVVLALAGAGIEGRVIELDGTARTAADAALACGVPVGAIVKSLVFLVGDRPVMALVAGDRRCRMAALAGAVDLEGEVRRADAERVRTLTGFAIGGVAPVGHPIPADRDFQYRGRGAGALFGGRAAAHRPRRARRRPAARARAA